MCGVGCAVRLGTNSLYDDHRFTLTPCNVVIAQSGTLVARYLALPLSPSFASPPPSLRSGTSPAGGLICLFGVLARSGATPKATFGYAGLHSTSGLSGGKLAALALPPNNPFVTLQPSSAKPRFLRAPSFARSKSGVWHCCAEPSVFCAVSAAPSAVRYGNFKL